MNSFYYKYPWIESKTAMSYEKCISIKNSYSYNPLKFSYVNEVDYFIPPGDLG